VKLEVGEGGKENEDRNNMEDLPVDVHVTVYTWKYRNFLAANGFK